MLRGLNVFERDPQTKLPRLDEYGRKVPLKGKGAGQPVPKDQWSADERHYYEVEAPRREQELRRLRAKEAAETAVLDNLAKGLDK